MSILFTFGVNDRDTARILPDKNGQPFFHLDGLGRVLDRIELDGINTQMLLIYGPGAKQPQFNLQSRPSLIFNQISNADSHHKALERCRTLCDILDGVPVVNHPDIVLKNTRDNVYRLLRDIPGVKAPKTVRCSPDSPQAVFEAIKDEEIGYPVIFRMAGPHNALTTVLIEGADDPAPLHAYPFDGRDYYLTEFVDYKDEQGIYTMHRIAMIGGEPYLRGMFYRDRWLVNSDAIEFMKSRSDLGDPVELMDKVEAERLPKAKEALEEIASRIGLDWFGIDCNISKDGTVVVFEANANMNLLIHVPGGFSAARFEPTRKKLKDYILKRAQMAS